LALSEANRIVSSSHLQLDGQTTETRSIQQLLSRAIRSNQTDQEHCLQAATTAQEQRRILNEAASFIKQSSQNAVATQRLGDSLQGACKNISQSLSQASSIAQRLTAC